MSSFVTLRTGVILGILSNNSPTVKINFPFNCAGKDTVIPAMFRKEDDEIVFFNGSVNEKDTITMTTPCLNHQQPYSVTALGRKGKNVTNLINELAQKDICRLHITANTADAEEFYTCTESIGVIADYKKAIPLGEYIKLEWVDSKNIILKSTQSFSSASFIGIKHIGDRIFNIYSIPADGDGVIHATLPVNIAEGDFLDILLAAYLKK